VINIHWPSTVLGPIERGTRPITRIPGTPQGAELANRLAAYNAYEHVFTHPDTHIECPRIDERPLFRVTTDASPVLARYNQPPSHRRTERRRGKDGTRRR
jgi:hypothetical protein